MFYKMTCSLGTHIEKSYGCTILIRWLIFTPVVGGCCGGWLLLLFHCAGAWLVGTLLLLGWPYVAVVLLVLLLFHPVGAVAVSPPPLSRISAAIPQRTLYIAATGMCSGVWLLLGDHLQLTFTWEGLEWVCALLLEKKLQFCWWPQVLELCNTILKVLHILKKVGTTILLHNFLNETNHFKLYYCNLLSATTLSPPNI